MELNFMKTLGLMNLIYAVPEASHGMKNQILTGLFRGLTFSEMLLPRFTTPSP